VTDLVLKELRFKHAQLDYRAERLRTEWRTAPSTGNRALTLGKQVKNLQEQADAYAALIEAAKAL
jgi:outer membrane murein-binding lipoprotein Lpp